MGTITTRTFKEFRERGLLWAINRQIFHPRGLAVAFIINDDGDVVGWDLVGNGKEVYVFDDKTDDSGFENFHKTLRELHND